MIQQINSFKALFPFVKSGDMYIIEDLHTSYWKGWGGYGSFHKPLSGATTAVTFLKNLVDDLNYTGAYTQCADGEKTPPDLQVTLNAYQDQIYSIHFYKSLCIINLYHQKEINICSGF